MFSNEMWIELTDNSVDYTLHVEKLSGLSLPSAYTSVYLPTIYLLITRHI